ncbi:MAG TPA: cupin domain-containing protein [Polyangiaceae bacterium]|nr:cupin domain-containing protein [Polyangiaceae bacterium]
MTADLPLVFSLAPEVLRSAPAFSAFRKGVEIARLYREGRGGASAAFLRYAPGASIPLHRHLGYEHILVLEGAQEDERGRYAAGTFVVNPPGSSHSVRSVSGCLVLVVWQRPVVFAPEADVAKGHEDTAWSRSRHDEETPIPR